MKPGVVRCPRCGQMVTPVRRRNLPLVISIAALAGVVLVSLCMYLYTGPAAGFADYLYSQTAIFVGIPFVLAPLSIAIFRRNVGTVCCPNDRTPLTVLSTSQEAPADAPPETGPAERMMWCPECYAMVPAEGGPSIKLVVRAAVAVWLAISIAVVFGLPPETRYYGLAAWTFMYSGIVVYSYRKYAWAPGICRIHRIPLARDAESADTVRPSHSKPAES